MDNSEITSKIISYYTEILGRPPVSNEIKYHLNKIKINEIDLIHFVESLKKSEEGLNEQSNKKKFEKLKGQIVKPIFIIGVPKSGTTLTYRIMCSHPELAWISNQDFQYWISKEKLDYYKDLYKKLEPFGKDWHQEIAVSVIRNNSSFYNSELYPPLNGSGKIPLEGDIFWSRFFPYAVVNDTSYSKKVDIIQKIQQMMERQGKSRFLNKNPLNFMRLFALKKIFPDAKFVRLMRDPKAVISSMLLTFNKREKFLKELPLKTKYQIGANSLERLSWVYREISEHMDEFALTQTKDNFLTVKYEDLIKNPNVITEKILQFAELKNDNVSSLIPEIISGTTEKWKETLSHEDQKKISEILSDLLNQEDYSYQF